MDEFAVIRQIADQVVIPGISAAQTHLGETYRDSPEWWARDLREAGATFAWLAYSFGDYPMWELHAGVVLTPDGAQVGLHCHKAARPECIEAFNQIGDQFGTVHDSQAANELQYNQAFTGHDSARLPGIAKRLSEIYVAARAGLKKQGLPLV